MRLVAFVTALGLAAPSAAAQSGAFIVRLGNDTVFVEQYRRSGTALEGDQVSRTRTVTTVRHFQATLDRRGGVVRYELAGRPAERPDAPAQTLRVTFDADTANVELVIGDSSRSVRLSIPGGAIPFVSQSYALLELVTQQARASGDTSYAVPILDLASLAPVAGAVTRGRGDTLSVVIGDGAPLRVRVDSAGAILSASGAGTTEQMTVERVSAVDIAGVTREFATRPLGQLSPADSVRATIAGAHIAIDYSRPAARGRTIFGALVPWNRVWRTGANAATRLTTSADLVMGGKTIPKGSYTLWTLPSPTGWKLIINRQTLAPCRNDACTAGARAPLWGTDYAADSDLVRVELRVARLPNPVERFTIAIAPQGTGGVLTFEWETTQASIPFGAN
jgi:hypothetical protein